MAKFSVKKLFALGLFLQTAIRSLDAQTIQVTNTSASGTGSLADATQTATQSGDLIQCVLGSSGSITLTSAITIGANITLYNTGSPVSIESNPTNTRFNVSGSITNFTIGTDNTNGTIAFQSPVFLISAASTATLFVNTSQLTFPGVTTLNQNWNVQFNQNCSLGNFIVNGVSPNNLVTVASGATASVNTLSGRALEKWGLGTLQILDAATNYTGATIIQQGTLALLGSGTISVSPSVTIASGATLDISGLSGSSAGVKELSGTGNVYLGNKNLTVTTVASTRTFSGTISGPGTFTLNIGTNPIFEVTTPQTFTGVTNLISGHLSLTGTGSFSLSSSMSLSGGILSLGGLTTPSYLQNLQGSSGTVTMGTQPLTILMNSVTTFAGSIASPTLNAGSVTIAGNGTLNLTAPCSYYGSTVVNVGATLGMKSTINNTSFFNIGGIVQLSGLSGTVTMNNISGSGQILGVGTQTSSILNPQTLQLNITQTCTYSGMIGGDPTQGQVMVTGGGHLILTGNIGYTGTIYVQNGILDLIGNGSLESLAFFELSTPSSTLRVADATANTVRINNLRAPAGMIDIGSKTLELYNTSLSGSGATIIGSGGLHFTGTDSFFISGPGLYSGPTVIDTYVSLSETLTTSGTISASQSVRINVQLDVTPITTYSSVLKNISGVGNFVSGTAGDNDTIFLMTTSQNFDGTFSGSGSTHVQGGGSLNLTQDQDYSGLMWVDAGRFGLNANIPAMDLHVQSAGRLYGNGTAHDLINSGMVSPGNSVGTIVLTGAYTQTGGAILDMEIDASGISDWIHAAGTATIGSGSIMQVTALPGFYSQGTIFTLLTADSGVTGSFLLNDLDATGFSLFQDANNVYLEATQGIFVIPVPTNQLTGYAYEVATSLFCPQVPGTRDVLAAKIALVNLSPSEYINGLTRLMPSQITGLTIVQLENTNRMIGNLQNRLNRLEKTVPCVEDFWSNWTTWVTPTTFWLRQEDTTEAHSFKTNTTGFSLGMEKFFNTNLNAFFTGFGGGYTYSTSNWFEGLGNAYTNQFYFGPYASLEYKKFYLSTSIMASYETTALHRVISFTDFYTRATSLTQGWNLTNMFDVKKSIDLNRCFYLLPEISMIFSQMWRNQSVESGAGNLDMDYSSQFNSSMRTFLNLGGGARGCVGANMAIDGRIEAGYLNTNLWTRNSIYALFNRTNQVCDPVLVGVGNLPSVNQGVIGCLFNSYYKEKVKLEYRANYTFGGHSSVTEMDWSLEVDF